MDQRCSEVFCVFSLFLLFLSLLFAPSLSSSSSSDVGSWGPLCCCQSWEWDERGFNCGGGRMLINVQRGERGVSGVLFLSFSRFFLFYFHILYHFFYKPLSFFTALHFSLYLYFCIFFFLCRFHFFLVLFSYFTETQIWCIALLKRKKLAQLR